MVFIGSGLFCERVHVLGHANFSTSPSGAWFLTHRRKFRSTLGMKRTRNSSYRSIEQSADEKLETTFQGRSHASFVPELPRKEELRSATYNSIRLGVWNSYKTRPGFTGCPRTLTITRLGRAVSDRVLTVFQHHSYCRVLNNSVNYLLNHHNIICPQFFQFKPDRNSKITNKHNHVRVIVTNHSFLRLPNQRDWPGLTHFEGTT